MSSLGLCYFSSEAVVRHIPTIRELPRRRADRASTLSASAPEPVTSLHVLADLVSLVLIKSCTGPLLEELRG
jgi:hypothetical protein